MGKDQERGLSRGLTNYGDKDFSIYLRNSFASSMGYSREVLKKPIVGIANSFSGFQQLPPPFSRIAGGRQTRCFAWRRAAGSSFRPSRWARCSSARRA